MSPVVLLLAVLVGMALGLLGGGGSILTVPLLVYIAGLDAKEAIATSLLVVGVTSLAALVPHARAGRVRWRTGAIFGAAAMAGAYAGGRIAEFIPGTVLLVAFALMMVATAVAMIRGRARQDAAGPGSGSAAGDAGGSASVRELPVKLVLLEGVVVGLVTGLVGAGGGFLVVPRPRAPRWGCPCRWPSAPSLLVIAMKSFAGLAGYLSSVSIDWGARGRRDRDGRARQHRRCAPVGPGAAGPGCVRASAGSSSSWGVLVLGPERPHRLTPPVESRRIAVCIRGETAIRLLSTGGGARRVRVNRGGAHGIR
jgi:uncharacterized membrane protein YfcA